VTAGGLLVGLTTAKTPGFKLDYIAEKGRARAPGRAGRLWGLFVCCGIHIQRGRDAKQRSELI
jgi:hypothetical protein